VNPPRSRLPAWAWLAYAAGLAGLLVLAVLPGHKYAWMATVDPATDPAALLDGSGNRTVLATLVMLAVVGLQLLWLLKAGRGHGRRHRVLPCLLIAGVLALWGLKF
jgi:hypothetical protein